MLSANERTVLTLYLIFGWEQNARQHGREENVGIGARPAARPVVHPPAFPELTVLPARGPAQGVAGTASLSVGHTTRLGDREQSAL